MTDTQTEAAVTAAVLLIRAREKRAAKKLLRAEADMLRAVRKAASQHIDQAVAGAVSGDSVADGVRRSRSVMAAMIVSLASTIAEARKAARESGAQDVEPEAQVQEDPADGARAFAAASSLAAAWGAMVMVQSRRVDDDTSRGTVARLVKQTSPLLDPRLRRIAATETADAFNQGRSQAIEARQAANDNVLARSDAPVIIPGGPYRTPDVATEPPVETRLKVWCAVLDMKVCPRCAEMDGKVVKEDETFPGGDAPLHPWCRCTFVLVPTSIPPAQLRATLRDRKTDDVAEIKPPASEAEVRKTVKEVVSFERLPTVALPRDPEMFAGKNDKDFVTYAGDVAKRFSGPQRQAIREFTGSDYGNIRRVQRISKTAAIKQYGAAEYRAYQNAIAQLDALHTAENAVPGVVWRGIAGLPDDVFKKFLAQDEMAFVGTSSTSRSPSHASKFLRIGESGDSGAVLFKIHQRTAVPVEAVGIAVERELLVKNGTKFRVVSRASVGSLRKTMLVELEEL